MVNPEQALRRFFPDPKDFTFALGLVKEAVRVAHAQNPRTWSLTFGADYLRLNTGRVEVFALYPNLIHLVVDADGVPSTVKVENRDIYVSIPGAGSLDLDPGECRRRIEAVREAWYSAIRTGAESARSASYRRYHNAAAVNYLKTVLPGFPMPEWSASDEKLVDLDRDDLSELKEGFLERFHDFGHFTDKNAQYWKEEREYKEEMRALCLRTLTPELLSSGEPDDLVTGALRVLKHTLKSTGKPQNVVNWRYFDFLPKQTTPEKTIFARAFRELLIGDSPSPERVEAYVARTWPAVRRAAGGKNLWAQSRIFPTFFLMMLNPGEDIAVRTDMFELASRGLLGESILENQPFSAKEYSAVLALADAVRDHLERWGWAPQDMIDVHSFLWVGTRESPKITED